MRNTLGANHSFVGASFQGLFLCLLVILPTFFSRKCGIEASLGGRQDRGASRYARIID